MLSRLMKFLLACSATAAGLYAISVFGPGLWSAVILAVALFLAVSAFVPGLDGPAKIAGHILGVLSLSALLLLVLAGTIGGQFHLSPSNQVIAVLLFLMTLFGMTSFFWPASRPRPPTESGLEPPPQT